MGFDNVNINVSGPVQPTSTYKTKVLKGNHSFASQVTEPNMKYVIKHDFDLNRQNVEIPEGCILEFDGGSISNGTLTGNNTILIYNQELDVIFKNVTREGTFIYNNAISADEEDLTEVGNLLKFKDRPNTNGMGRKILRKNIVDGVNTLTQSMISQANTIYVIQYDFTLSEDITIPANCILEFDGGSISAGSGENKDTITGTNTGINAGLVNILNTDVTLAGTWNISEVNTKWFGGKGDGITDETVSLQKAIDFSYDNNVTLYITEGKHITTKPLMVWGGIDYYTNKSFYIHGSNYKTTIIEKHGTEKSTYTDYNAIDSVLILANSYIREGNTISSEFDPNAYCRNGIIESITLTRDVKTDDTKGIYAIGWINIRFNNINIEKCYSGFYTKAYNTYSNYYKCNVDFANVAFDFDNALSGGQTTMLFDSCHVNGSIEYAFAIRGTGTFINCSVDGGRGVAFYASKYERQNNPPTVAKLIILSCHVESTALTNLILCDYGNVTATDSGFELPSEVEAVPFKVINKGRLLIDNCRFSVRYNNVQSNILCNTFYECDKNSIFTMRSSQLDKNYLINKQRIPYTDCKELTFDNADIAVNTYLDYISGGIPSASRPTPTAIYNNELILGYDYQEGYNKGNGGYQIQKKIDTSRYTKLEVSLDSPEVVSAGSLKFAFDNEVIPDGSQYTSEYVHDYKVGIYNDTNYSYNRIGKDTFIIDIPYLGEEVYLSIITRPSSAGLKVTQLKLY